MPTCVIHWLCRKTTAFGNCVSWPLILPRNFYGTPTTKQTLNVKSKTKRLFMVAPFRKSSLFVLRIHLCHRIVVVFDTVIRVWMQMPMSHWKHTIQKRFRNWYFDFILKPDKVFFPPLIVFVFRTRSVSTQTCCQRLNDVQIVNVQPTSFVKIVNNHNVHSNVIRPRALRMCPKMLKMSQQKAKLPSHRKFRPKKSIKSLKLRLS